MAYQPIPIINIINIILPKQANKDLKAFNCLNPIIIPNNLNNNNNIFHFSNEYDNIYYYNYMAQSTEKNEINHPKKKPHPKNKFTPTEDQKLINIVKNYDFTLLKQDSEKKSKSDIHNWVEIAKQLDTGRNARQCRDRWINYLSPLVQKNPWTDEEDKLLLQKYQEIGPKWTKIASFFDSRTDINLKNRFKLIQRKFKREAKILLKNVDV